MRNTFRQARIPVPFTEYALSALLALCLTLPALTVVAAVADASGHVDHRVVSDCR